MTDLKATKETIRKYYKYIESAFIQPVLGDNGTMGGGVFSCQASSTKSTNTAAWKAFDGVTSDSSAWQSPSSDGTPQWLAFYNPNPIKVTQLVIGGYSSTGTYYIKRGIIQASNDNSTWTDLKTFTNSSWVTSSTVDLSDNTNFYKYYRIYIAERGYYQYGYWMEAIISEVTITGTVIIAEESTAQDYDYYKDFELYKGIKQSNITYYKYTDTPNAVIVGSPTISNGIASNFTTSNYLEFPNSAVFNPQNNSWEILFKFTTDSSISNTQIIFTSMNGANLFGGIAYEIYQGNFYLMGATNASSWDIQISTSIAVNTTYWVKAKFTGTQYLLYFSSDGKTYTLKGSYISSNPIYSPIASRIGGDSRGTNPAFAGFIDLKNSYIKIGKSVWWRGMEYVESTESDYDFYEGTIDYKVVSF